MPSTLPPPDHAALIRAIDHNNGPCSCGPLVRLGMMSRCEACQEKIHLLAEILAASDTRGRATIDRWMDFKANMEVFRLGEPFS